MENEIKEAAPKYNYITPEQYLEIERNAEVKHEYYEGQVIAMPGASLKHNRIAINLYNNIGDFLTDKNCEILPSEMSVSTPNHESYMYPGAVIVCGEPELEDDKFDTLTNPSVIFEILSRSTRSIDKEAKFFFYRQIPSLKEYIMIDSTKRAIIVSRKEQGELWKFENIGEYGFELFVATINFKLTLEAIYSGTGL